MRVALRYRRLPKPRGAWNHGLWAAFAVAYTAEERAALAPDWSAPLAGDALACTCRDKTARDGASGKTAQHDFTRPGLRPVVDRAGCGEWTWVCAHDTGWETTFWFSEPGRIELVVAFLHRLRDHALAAAAAWWHAHPPVPGDAAETVLEEEWTGGEPIARPARKLRVLEGVA